MNDLKERYIYAVVKRMPHKVRADISRELGTLIDDMLEARCGEDAPTEKDLRVVLTELGTPSELYEKYNPDAGKALIGEAYFPFYKKLLKIVGCAIAGGMAVGYFMAVLFEVKELFWWQWLGNFLLSTWNAELSAFAIVTIVFCIAQKKGVRIGQHHDSLDDLPAVPKNKNRISKGDCIADIVLTLVFLVFFLIFPDQMRIQGSIAGRFCQSPIFAESVIRSLWLPIAGFGALMLTRDILRLVQGERSRLLASICAGLNAAGIALAGWTFLRIGLLSMEYVSFIENAAFYAEIPPMVYKLMMHPERLLFYFIAFALALDTVEDVLKAFRHKKI